MPSQALHAVPCTSCATTEPTSPFTGLPSSTPASSSLARPLPKPTCFLLYQRPLDSTASRLWYDYDEEDHRHPMTFYSMVPAAL
eukprot:CAMPEP_0119474738 /NCGR_PEP_ID=MMETSP1344-20130328/5877_1 /TAXON_ID=236787 /ORGANISM="Florenciella parvula, Strain CCMP2471" /LENGTH=83 /DNA_ID=CAMNT_0007508087 /DNA_START=148 /DNA_END=396 /DNA_ORIENTATION=+